MLFVIKVFYEYFLLEFICSGIREFFFYLVFKWYLVLVLEMEVLGVFRKD